MASSHRKKRGSNSWKNICRRFWRKEAKQVAAVELWGEENVKRMKSGAAPQRRALVRPNGKNHTEERLLSCELHHVFGIKPEPTDEETIVMVWPHHHAAMDPSRHIDFEFIKWVES